MTLEVHPLNRLVHLTHPKGTAMTENNRDYLKFVARHPESFGQYILEGVYDGTLQGEEATRTFELLLTALDGDRAAAVSAVLAFGERELTDPDDTRETERWRAEHVLDLLHVRPTHATIYVVDRLDGGPEEGGWSYDAGTVEEVREIPADVDLEAYVAALRSEYPDNGYRSSVRPRGTDYSVHIGYAPGKSYPEFRPHYS